MYILCTHSYSSYYCNVRLLLDIDMIHIAMYLIAVFILYLQSIARYVYSVPASYSVFGYLNSLLRCKPFV